jgi:hypothetical protein
MFAMIILNSRMTSVLVRRGALPVFSIGFPKIVIFLIKSVYKKTIYVIIIFYY